jgi:hypothetical protein
LEFFAMDELKSVFSAGFHAAERALGFEDCEEGGSALEIEWAAFASTEANAEVERLREALIAMGRMIPGVMVSDRASNDFLTKLPEEMAHYHLRRAALAQADQPSAAAIPAGMVPWHGGDGAPDDWDGGNCLTRQGELVLPLTDFRWLQGPALSSDIIAYTPTQPTTEAGSTVAAGEWVMVPREPTRQMLAAVGKYPDTNDHARAQWSAMLAAVPPAPASQDEVARLRDADAPIPPVIAMANAGRPPAEMLIHNGGD